MPLKPAKIIWSDDGKLYNPDYDDVYFQPDLAIEESLYVYLKLNNLPERFKNLKEPSFSVGEFGFGTGLNFLLTCDLFFKTAPPNTQLNYISFEKNPLQKIDLIKIYQSWPDLKYIADAFLESYPPLIAGHHTIKIQGRINLTLCFGDIKDSLPEINAHMDAWFLDGFTPAKNPDIWSEELFTSMAKNTKKGATLSTFTAAAFVKNNLNKAGFHVEKAMGFGRKRKMFIGRLETSIEKIPDPYAISNPCYTNQKAIVLGAGIAGCSVAHALAARGWEAHLIDKHDVPASETSGNPVGIIYPKITVEKNVTGDFYTQSFCYSYQMLNILNTPGWVKSGVLQTEKSTEQAQRHKRMATELGLPHDFMYGVDQDRASEIAGIKIKTSGLYFPMAGYVAPPKFCKALSQHKNITFSNNTQIGRIEKQDQDWYVFDQNDQLIDKAPVLVLANGTCANENDYTNWLPLKYVRGQISELLENKGSQNLKTVLSHDGYTTPPVEGVHYIGASFERVEEIGDTIPTDHEHLHNLKMTQRHLPNSSIKDIKSGRVGYRCTTPDYMPIIGAVPDHNWFFDNIKWADRRKPNPKHIDGLYVSSGFGSHGMSTAPMAGEVIACIITGAPLPMPQSVLRLISPQRFLMRSLKKRA